jgi:hypothetical protein
MPCLKHILFFFLRYKYKAHKTRNFVVVMIIVVTNHISIFPKMPICLLKLFQTEDRLKEGFPQIISLRLTANIQ